MKMQFFRLVLLLLFAGGMSSTYAAPQVVDDQSGAKMGFFATYDATTGSFIAPAPAEFSDEFNYTTAEDPCAWDDGNYTYNAVSVPIPASGSCMRPATLTNNNVQNCEGARCSTMGGYTVLIFQSNNGGNSADVTTTCTTAIPDYDIGCHLFFNSTSGNNPAKTG